MDLRKYPVVYACLFPCCGRKFAGTDAARKHARQQHAVWLAALPAARVTSDNYCRQVLRPMHIVERINAEQLKRYNAGEL